MGDRWVTDEWVLGSRGGLVDGGRVVGTLKTLTYRFGVNTVLVTAFVAQSPFGAADTLIQCASPPPSPP